MNLYPGFQEQFLEARLIHVFTVGMKKCQELQLLLCIWNYWHHHKFSTQTGIINVEIKKILILQLNKE